MLKSNQLNGNAASAVLYTSLELMVGFNGMTNDDHARSDPINDHNRLIIIIITNRDQLNRLKLLTVF